MMHYTRWLRFGSTIVLACLALGASAQSQVDLESVAGIPAFKTMRSIKDMRYRDIVRQEYDFSCGSAALSTLLKYGYGINIPEAEMIKRMMVYSTPAVVIKSGFSMLDMKKFVETLGFQGRGFRVNVHALYDLRIPVIALMDINGYQHFVLIKGARDGRIFLADPALGNRVVEEADFARQWDGLILAVVGKPFLEDSPLLQGNYSLALRQRAGALATSARPTPEVDFGLIKSNLF
ncbi:peptidase C39 [Pandoraea thiooxydans]|uniref:Peptidase C39 n=1 Tax=Pandoraea thiooxydans TaxID=445709 RepID=A0A0G3END8_9BURK|nr:C39 family peptidase [Pandoraea thiooxydans]AKJ68470.1 peptidase C39 [Pandoraea thiooxydans]APR95850.1 peptidase C39 [Pandoraea thiooxydans]